jgi:hypothetical protein
MYNRARKMYSMHLRAGHCRTSSCEKIGNFLEISRAKTSLGKRRLRALQPAASVEFVADASPRIFGAQFPRIIHP